jgi:hypothetical protein
MTIVSANASVGSALATRFAIVPINAKAIA